MTTATVDYRLVDTVSDKAYVQVTSLDLSRARVRVARARALRMRIALFAARHELYPTKGGMAIIEPSPVVPSTTSFSLHAQEIAEDEDLYASVHNSLEAYLRSEQNRIQLEGRENAMLSEPVLRRLWLTPEEDEA